MATGQLTGQVAIVTGASTGIGRAAAMALATEGAKVAVVARSADKLETLKQEIERQAAPPSPTLPMSRMQRP